MMEYFPLRNIYSEETLGDVRLVETWSSSVRRDVRLMDIWSSSPAKV